MNKPVATVNKRQQKEELKRRGRKRERDDLYFSKAEDRIAELKRQLATAKQDGLTVKERQRLRNQVSAQQSRIKRKGEAMFLNKTVTEKDEMFKELIKYMGEKIDQHTLQQIFSHFNKKWSINNPETNTVVMTDKDLKKLAVKKPQLAKLTRNSSKNTGMSFNTISISPDVSD